MLIFCSLIFINYRTNPIFTQNRVGLNGKTFSIIKLKTMDDGIGGGAITTKKDHRVTKLGSFLRATKIDELPQLINVFVGQMSIVGPRPDVPQEIALISDHKRRQILSVRPGLISFASIIYINESDLLFGDDYVLYYRDIIFQKKVNLNILYLRKQNFCIDFFILWRTFTSLIIICWRKIFDANST